VSLIEQLGGEALLHVTLRGAPTEPLVAKVAGDVSLAARAAVALRIDGAPHLFDASGRAIP
jgi:hypothetical protein